MDLVSFMAVIGKSLAADPLYGKIFLRCVLEFEFTVENSSSQAEESEFRIVSPKSLMNWDL